MLEESGEKNDDREAMNTIASFCDLVKVVYIGSSDDSTFSASVSNPMGAIELSVPWSEVPSLVLSEFPSAFALILREVCFVLMEVSSIESELCCGWSMEAISQDLLADIVRDL